MTKADQPEVKEQEEIGCEHQTRDEVEGRWGLWRKRGTPSEVSICLCCTGPALPLLRKADEGGSVTFSDGTFMTGLPPFTTVGEAHNCRKCGGE